MGIVVQYTGDKAIHTSGVDVGPSFIHLDLDGPGVELPDDIAKALCAEQPRAFKKVTVKKVADDIGEDSDKGDK